MGKREWGKSHTLTIDGIAHTFTHKEMLRARKRWRKNLERDIKKAERSSKQKEKRKRKRKRRKT